MHDLTEKQEELLTTLIKFIEENGYQPTLKDLGQLLGCSQSAVHTRLSTLAAKGYGEMVNGNFKFHHLRFRAVMRDSHD